MAHWSDCAQHNATALPVGPCDCGGDAPVYAWTEAEREILRKRGQPDSVVNMKRMSREEYVARFGSPPATEYQRLNFGKLD